MSTQTSLGVYLSYIDQTLKFIGEDSAKIFNSANLEYPEYAQPGERVAIEVLNDLVKQVRAQCRCPHFFLMFGQRVPIMAHGPLGAAMMACQNVEAAFSLIERYAAIAMPALRLSVIQDKNDVVLEYQLTSPSNELNIALIEAIISSTSHNFSVLTGTRFYPKQIQVIYEKPSYAERYQEYAPCDIQFNSAANRFIFAKNSLSLPIATADRLSEAFMVSQCESDLKKIQSQMQVTDRIREIISLYLDHSPSIGFVAEKLRMSERTLRRRLNEEGINYRDLLKQIRHEMAVHYLLHSDIRIEQLAWQLGYKEAANFRKAFKEQTHMSPRQWRQHHKHK